MNRYCRMVLIFAALSCCAQETQVERVTVPFSDPGRPGLVKVNLLTGGISVKGYTGKEVIVEPHRRGQEASPPPSPNPKAEGLKRVGGAGAGLSIEEQDNVVSVGVRSLGQTVDLALQVPAAASLNLRCMNDGDITVEQVNGEIDVTNLNGGVTLTNISGTVVAHALNRDVTVVFDKVAPGKSMSFTSLNGDIDVTLPPDAKARVKMKTENGEIYSDFDIQLDSGAPQPKADKAGKTGGKSRPRSDRTMYGTINGGGTEMQLTSFNGKIYIRKKK